MASTPLFSSYRTGENRVTGSMLAVFERVGLDVLERLLGPASGEDDLALVRFRNQITDTAGSVPDASISAGFRLLLEVKTVPDTPDSGLGDQVERHLAGLDGSYAQERLYVITPDVQAPVPLGVFEPSQVAWVNFAGLDAAIAAVLDDADQPVSEQSAFLLRELRRLFDVEGLLDQQDTVIVAARRAFPAYEKTSAYVCQPGRSFRRGLSYVGFYADGEIKPMLARIHQRTDDVLFTARNAEQLRASGETALADAIEKTLAIDSEREGQKWQVLLLSSDGAPETVDLPSAVRNTTVVNGRPWAWTLGQRYARSDVLKRGFATTTELNAEGTDDRPMMNAPHDRPHPRDRDDSKPFVVPWTEDLALRAARVDKSRPRREQVAALRDARLSDEVIGLLISAGWSELLGTVNQPPGNPDMSSQAADEDQRDLGAT